MTAITLIALFSSTGCAAKVNRDALMTIKRVGILSITIDKIGSQPSDDEVMQSTVNYAARMYTDALANRPEWKLVPLSAYKDKPNFRDFLKPPVPQKQQKRSEAKGFAATLNKLNAQWEAGLSVEKVSQRESSRYLAAQNMPIVACNMIWRPSGDDTTESKKGTKQSVGDLAGYRKEMLPKIGELASKLDLDGLIVVYLQTGIRHTIGGSVSIGERGNDTIRMEPAIILISRDGKVVIDIQRPIDAVSPAKASVPIYKVERHGGITLSSRQIGIIDLKDPQGNVQKDFYALAEVAARDFTKNLKEVLEKKAR